MAKRYLLLKDIRNVMAHASEAERQEMRDTLSNQEKLEALIKDVLQEVLVIAEV